ncbi:MAG: amphi-Trp domain-containing protein [Pseudonocardia sp.]|nr:amphi-Trp domain-containing protein [Pseudonocardia sp.]
MSDVEISRTESLTRHEAARRLSALAAALDDGGRVVVELGASTLKLNVPDHVRCEVEVEVDGDEVELELELKWSTAPAPADGPVKEQAKAKTTRRTRAAG